MDRHRCPAVGLAPAGDAAHMMRASDMTVALVVGAIAAIALAAGCASGNRSVAARPQPAPDRRPAPAWIEAPPSEPGMLYAVGSAPAGDRQRAVAAAREELASEIEVSVEAEHAQREASAVTSDSSGHHTEHYDRDVRSLARTRVAQRQLPGVMVRETYDSDDRTYALVAMDRSAWAAQLRAHIDALDARLAQASAAHDAGKATEVRPVAALARYYQELAPLASERSELEARHRLAGGADLPHTPVDIDTVRADLARQLRSLGIHIVAAEAAVALAPLARDACARQGLLVEDSAPQLRLEVSSTSTVGRIGSEYRADGALTAALRSADDGRTLAEVTLDARASGLDAATARQRLLEKLAAALASRLDDELVSFVARW